MEFYPIGTWYQHEENIIMYLFREGFEEQEADWVGIYEVGILNLISLLHDFMIILSIEKFHESKRLHQLRIHI